MVEINKKPKRSKKKLGSYPFVSTVFSITLALLVTGVFGTLLIYSDEVKNQIRAKFAIQVYLKNGLSEAQRLQIETNLLAQEFVPKGQEGTITFISKEAAAENFIKDTGEDFKRLLGDNPLRESFDVKVLPEFQTKEQLARIKTTLEQINGVFVVDYPELTIASFNENLATVKLVLLGAAALLLAAVVVLINNTLRLAIFSQRFLIRSMQLVGANRWFIQRPFLGRAALHGLLAGVLASAVIVGLTRFATSQIEILGFVENKTRLATLLASLVVMGIFVAVASTYWSVSRYLKMSLDELY